MYFGCSLFLLVILFPLIRARDECGCTEVMVCPPNSNTSGYGAASVDDCVCNPGYLQLEGICVEVFECPPNSTTEFVLTAGGCTCADGFTLLEGMCVELFNCPANSHPDAQYSNTSTASMDDCVCDPGYVRLGIMCVEVFDCPPNSTTDFVLNAGGCTCVDGFVPSGGECVEMFRCPANSQPVRGFALSFLDCQCVAEFVRSTVGGECVCPANSVKSPDLGGCVCVSGYTRLFANESCVPETLAASPVALIASVAVGGSAVLAGSAWVAAQFVISAPASAATSLAGTVGNPAAIKLFQV